MWDNEILKKYTRRNSKIFDSGKGYCFFLKKMNEMAKQIEKYFRIAQLNPLAKPEQTPAEYLSEQLKYNHSKTMAKYLDEYNWVTITNEIQVPPSWYP